MSKYNFLIAILFYLASIGEVSADEELLKLLHQTKVPGRSGKVVLSGDGKTYAVICKKLVRVFRTESGKEIGVSESENEIADIDLSFDGSRIAIAADSPNIQIYDTRKNKIVQSVHRNDIPSSLRQDRQLRVGMFGSGKNLVSTGSSQRVFLSNVDSGDWEMIMFIKYSTAKPVVSSNDQFVLLYGGVNDREISGQLTLFKVRLGLQPLWTKWHETREPVTYAAFSADSSQLLSISDDGIRVWTTKSGKLVQFFKNTKERFLHAAFLDSTKEVLAAVDGKLVKLSRKGDSRSIIELEGLAGFCLDNNGSRIVTWTKGGVVSVWAMKFHRQKNDKKVEGAK